MAKKFRGPEIVKEIDDAMNKGLARFLILTQSKLSKAAPVHYGRLASSFMIGAGSPNRDVPPERDSPGTPTVEKPNFKITLDKDHYISSSLDYSQRVCFDPKWAKGGRIGGAQWFTRIVNNLDKDAENAFNYFLRKVK